MGLTVALGAGLLAVFLFACGNGAPKEGNSSPSAAQPAQAAAAAVAPSDALPADKTGGFDGARAFDHVAKIVAIGPRPPDSDGIHREQEYIHAQLKSFGCTVEDDDFHASTPIGSVAMKNIVAKIPGSTPDMIVLMTHYDTLKQDGFVGAEDSASSTGSMLEMARLLCPKKQRLGVWIAFVDGEEAFVNWNQDNDNTYGSRQLAARMALADELKHVKALILADMIGQKNPEDRTRLEFDGLAGESGVVNGRETRLSGRLRSAGIQHRRRSPRLHCAPRGSGNRSDRSQRLHATGLLAHERDTLDKVSARSLGIVGHVILATMDDLQSRK